VLNVFDGQITQADGLRDALEGILSAKAVQNGVLRIRSDLVSGRVGIFCARFITGAQVDSTGESGGLALRRLLSARNGSFSFEDARGSDISDLKQSLSIDVEILLENMTQLLDGKSVTLSDGSMFGFAMPAQRIRKLTGEDAAPPAAPSMPLPAAVPATAQPGPAPVPVQAQAAQAPAATAPPIPAGSPPPSGGATKLSAQWKLLSGQQGDASAAGQQPLSPAVPPDSSNGESISAHRSMPQLQPQPQPQPQGAESTGDFVPVTPASAAAAAAAMPELSSIFGDVEPPPPSLEREIPPSENTDEFDSLRLSTDEQRALEITGEFGTVDVNTHSEDVRYHAQTSKPSSQQPKPALAVPAQPASPPQPPQPPQQVPQQAFSAPQPPAQPIAAPVLPPQPAAGAAGPSAGPLSMPLPGKPLQPVQPVQPAQPSVQQPSVFSEAAAAFASQQAPGKPEFEDLVCDLKSPATAPPPGGPQPGLVPPAKNELEDFVSELQAYSNNMEEVADHTAPVSQPLNQPLGQPLNHPLSGGTAKSELDDFVSEMQGVRLEAQPERKGLIKPAANELEDFAAEMREHLKVPGQPVQPVVNPFNDEPIPPESGSFGIGDLFAAATPKKAPEPPPQKPPQKMSGSEYTMADLFSSKQGARPGGPGADAQQPAAPAPAAVPPEVLPRPASPSMPSPAAAAFAADQTPLALSAIPPDNNPFSDAFSERSPGLGNESIRPSQPMGDARSAMDNQSVRPSSSGSEPSRSAFESDAKQSTFGSMSPDSKAANTLPPSKSQQSAPLSGAAAGLPSEQSKSGGPLAGLPSEQGKPTSDYQLPSQQAATGSQRTSGQTMKSALSALPSMSGKSEPEAPRQSSVPAPDDWPDDFPPPEKMRRNTDQVQKPVEKTRPAEPVPSWDDPAFDPEELMRKRRERKGAPVDPSDDPFSRIAQTRANESASSDSRLRAIVEEGSSQSAFAPIAHPKSMVKPTVQHGPKPGFRKLNQWNSTGVMAVKIFGVLLILGAGAGLWHVYGGTVIEAFNKMTAPPPPPPPKPAAVTKPKTEPTTTTKKKKRRKRRSSQNR
jgi:hypothetical protein